jgi:uncharacterized protein
MSTERSGLSQLLFGSTRSGVLGLLYGRADQSFYLRQISRHVQASTGALQRELKQLADAGLIVRKPLGNQVFYQANRESPVFGEMRALVTKTVGVSDVLYHALSPLAKKIAVAFVYGSVARQEEKAESDVDLMILGTASLDEVVTRLSRAEKVLGRSVNPTLYPPPEFKSKLASGNYFLRSVLKGEKLFVLGNDDELRKMGRVRVAQTPAHQRR